MKVVEMDLAASARMNRVAFVLPTHLIGGPWDTVGGELFERFGVLLEPLEATKPFEEMTAGDVSDWVYGSIEKLRAKDGVPYEGGHVWIVEGIFREVGIAVPRDRTQRISLEGVSAGKYARLGRLMKQRMGIVAGVTLSGTGCVVSLVVTGVVYVSFLMWFDKVVGHVGMGVKRALGWFFFVGAMMLASGIYKAMTMLLAPKPPRDMGSVTELAEMFASRLTETEVAGWTRESVCAEVKQVVARAFRMKGEEVKEEMPLGTKKRAGG